MVAAEGAIWNARGFFLLCIFDKRFGLREVDACNEFMVGS